MRKPLYFFLLTAALFSLAACEDYVTNVDEPINLVPSEQLSTPSQIQFLTNGLKGTFAETHDQLTVTAGGLSDEQVFDRDLPQATFPSYDRLERGALNIDDGTINDELGQLRFYADDLVERINGLEEVGDEFQEDQREALFYGSFLGGVARAWYASYMGLEPGGGGGGVINDGPFVPSSEMYAQALEKMEAALPYATDYQARVVQSTMARVHLYAEEYPAALEAAKQGLTMGDEPFASQHNVQSTNAWYFAAGEGRVQFRADERYAAYVSENPDEASRIPLWELEGRSGTVWHVQDKYPERGTPIPFIDWQETHLMLAELGLREGDGSIDPLALVNDVRSSHGIEPLSTLSLQGEGEGTIVTERDKELFTRGQRLVDQRRFGLWHLGPETWKYFPISEEERNNNPNL